ncbi:ABC transporter substrate-binding protein [Leucobacter sp. CSA1]|uniref:ABC transporter substrate-binding protein n=1 Tax=Leucobacter chromiisoli TaxID=2796471 RepID=A0A934QA39_9MICO|nr:ABC transporter substrate-binding protein [Leucobacter chromiisoli]MBK0419562.1 ABC transporter substrate-binding protein [Leucobacter chromiisoli]
MRILTRRDSAGIGQVWHRTAGLAALLALGLAATGCSGGAAEEKPGREVDVNEEAVELLPDDVREAGRLAVGTNAPYAPMVMFEEDGTTLTGVEVDLMDEISARLGLENDWDNTNWDGLLTALRAGRYDVAIASIGDRPERRDTVDFVDYAVTGMAAVVDPENEGDYSENTDLCGKQVGYQTGVAAESILTTLSETECAEAGLEPISMAGFPDDNAGLLALRSGRVDAHVMDSLSAYFEQSSETGKGSYATVLDGLYHLTPYGIAIDNQHDGLAEAVQMVLNDMISDGTYEQILDDYSVPAAAITEALINGGTQGVVDGTETFEALPESDG